MIKFLLLLLMFLSISFQALSKGLLKGERAPQFKINDITGKKFNLKATLKKTPVVLVFYRGGWCPYCSLQLRALKNDVLPSLKDKNVELVAISVDRVEEGIKISNQESLNFTVLSDTKASVVKKYKVDSLVSEMLFEKYKNKYKIDLEKASGRSHHIISLPAVYVINQKRNVTFSYVSKDYKTRAQTKDILKAVEAL